MRHYIDHVMAVLPFEPAVHQRLGGPPCSYVGHPLLEQIGTLRPDENERARRAGKVKPMNETHPCAAPGAATLIGLTAAKAASR